MFSNVTVKFFPANTTAKCQPMDAGVIANLKQLYKKMVVHKMLHMLDTDPNSIYKTLLRAIDIKKACLWIAMALRRVKPETIRNCLAKVAIDKVTDDDNLVHNFPVDEDDDLDNSRRES